MWLVKCDPILGLHINGLYLYIVFIIWDKGDFESYSAPHHPTNFRRTKETIDMQFVEIIMLKKNYSRHLLKEQ